MLKRARVWIGVVLAVGITIATVSWTRAVSVRLTDERGAPASDAYVRYHYEGYLINPAHPVTYVARGSVIIRADSDGRFTIPARIHARRPLPLSTPPRVFIDHVVVPGCTTRSARLRMGQCLTPVCSRRTSGGNTLPSSM